MTASTGMRRRYGPKQQGSASTGTRVANAPVALDNGGTGARTDSEALANLKGASLDGNNVFTGTNEFQAATTMASLVASGTLVVSGATVFDDPVSINSELTVASVADLGGRVDCSGGVRIQSGLELQYVAKTANYPVVVATDIVVDVTANSPTITLPTAVGHNALVIIKNSGAGVVTLATTSSQTIDGIAPGTLLAGTGVRLVSTGANWITV